MYALTVTEPYATLIAIGAKSIETRGWATSYRGPLAIHAAKGMTGDDLDIARHNGAIADALARAGVVVFAGGSPHGPVKAAFPDTRGRVIATCRLVAVVRTRPYLAEWGTDERRFGDFSPGRWAWVLADVRPLPAPVPARGALGLWVWDGAPDAPGSALREDGVDHGG